MSLNVDNIEVSGFSASIRGMRNPMNSWKLSDSKKCSEVFPYCISCPIYERGCGTIVSVNFGWIGEKDLDLMHRLYKAGTEHRKYLRMIHVSMDITAPLYWWKEFDTYKVGTVANSCSTMHKIHARAFELNDFSHEHLTDESKLYMNTLIDCLNECRNSYLTGKDKKDWWQLIQLLPASYNQRRTVDFNYETAITLIKQRTGHKLNEWNTLVWILRDLPYIKEIMQEDNDD